MLLRESSRNLHWKLTGSGEKSITWYLNKYHRKAETVKTVTGREAAVTQISGGGDALVFVLSHHSHRGAVSHVDVP